MAARRSRSAWSCSGRATGSRSGRATLTYEPLSDRWKALYRDRVDAVVRVFHDRNIPLVWVGLPPMKNDKVSADLIVMNEIVRDSVQRAGFTYVDIWPGFVDDDNRYTVVRPRRGRPEHAAARQ